jgi:hypothetical protein
MQLSGLGVNDKKRKSEARRKPLRESHFVPTQGQRKLILQDLFPSRQRVLGYLFCGETRQQVSSFSFWTGKQDGLLRRKSDENSGICTPAKGIGIYLTTQKHL